MTPDHVRMTLMRAYGEAKERKAIVADLRRNADALDGMSAELLRILALRYERGEHTGTSQEDDRG